MIINIPDHLHYRGITLSIDGRKIWVGEEWRTPRADGREGFERRALLTISNPGGDGEDIEVELREIVGRIVEERG